LQAEVAMWLISFHGGEEGTNNIHVHHDTGKPHDHPALLPTGHADPDLRELRAFRSVGTRLYVVRAYNQESAVLRYARRPDGRYVFDRVFASTRTVPALVHPYDVAADADGRLYVSSQDTNVVTGLDASGTTLPVASHLATSDRAARVGLAAGTMVASSVGALPGAAHPAPDVPRPQGLGVTFDDAHRRRVVSSVRGVLCHAGHLYVADEPENAVKVYVLATGALRAQIAGPNLREPVQLLLNASDGRLYIGSKGNDSILTCPVAGSAPVGRVEPRTFIDGKVKHVSGMAFDAAGRFYAAERRARRIRMFPPDGRGAGDDFITGLPDEPEFIHHVPKTASPGGRP
jgi:outer membrane protein assembly factor BamB